MSAVAVLLVLIVLAIIGGGAGYYYTKKKNPAAADANAVPTAITSTTATNPVATPTSTVEATPAAPNTIATTNTTTPVASVASAPTSSTNLAPAVLPTDGYSFNSGMDSGGNDIRREWPANVSKLKSSCSADTVCRGFNTNGYLKRAIRQSNQWDNLGAGNVAWDPNTPVEERGLYVKL